MASTLLNTVDVPKFRAEALTEQLDVTVRLTFIVALAVVAPAPDKPRAVAAAASAARDRSVFIGQKSYYAQNKIGKKSYAFLDKELSRQGIARNRLLPELRTYVEFAQQGSGKQKETKSANSLRDRAYNP